MGSANFCVSLDVTHRTLTLGSTSGLHWTTGDGGDDASIVFSGTLAEVNAALDNLRYDPTAGYNGGATLTLTVDDQGASGSGGAHSTPTP